MTIPSKLLLRAQWRRRSESTTEVADRVWALLTALSRFSGEFSAPFFALADRPLPLSNDRGAVESLVADGRDFDGPNGQINAVSGMRLAALQRPSDGPDVPRIHVSVRAGSTAGGLRNSVANSALVTFSDGASAETDVVGHLIHRALSNGVKLVEEMVRIWEPDSASLDSRELLLPQRRFDATVPTIGFTTWLSDDVTSGDLSQIEVFDRRRIANGSLLSVDLSTDHVLEDGLRLVDRLAGSRLVQRMPVDYRPSTP